MKNEINTNFQSLSNYNKEPEKYELRITKSIWGMHIVELPKDRQKTGIVGGIRSLCEKIIYYDPNTTTSILRKMSNYSDQDLQKTSKTRDLFKSILNTMHADNVVDPNAQILIKQVVRKIDIENMLDQMSMVIKPLTSVDRLHLVNVLAEDSKLYDDVSNFVTLINKAKANKAPLNREIQLEILSKEKDLGFYLMNTYPTYKKAEESEDNILSRQKEDENTKTRELVRLYATGLTSSVVDINFARNEVLKDINKLSGKDNPLSTKDRETLTNAISSNTNPAELLSLLKNTIWLCESMKAKGREAAWNQNLDPDITNEYQLFSCSLNHESTEVNDLNSQIPNSETAQKVEGILTQIQLLCFPSQNIQLHSDHIIPTFLLNDEVKKQLDSATLHRSLNPIESAQEKYSKKVAKMPAEDSPEFPDWQADIEALELEKKYFIRGDNFDTSVTWEMSDRVKLFEEPFIADRVISLRLKNGHVFEARAKLDLSPLGTLDQDTVTKIFIAYSKSIGNKGLDKEVLKANIEELKLDDRLVGIIADFDQNISLARMQAFLRFGDKDREDRYQEATQILIPMAQKLLGPNIKLDSSVEKSLLTLLTEHPEFVTAFKDYLGNVQKARQETIDDIKNGTFSKDNLSELQKTVYGSPTSVFKHLLLIDLNYDRKDPQINALIDFFSTLRDTAVVGNTQMNIDCIIPVEILENKNITHTRSRRLDLLNGVQANYNAKVAAFKKTLTITDPKAIEEAIKNDPALKKARDNILFVPLSGTDISYHAHWEKTPKLTLDDEIAFKGDRVITFKTKDGGETEARFELDLTPLGEMDGRSLDFIFQCLEMSKKEFAEKMKLLSLYQLVDPYKGHILRKLHEHSKVDPDPARDTLTKVRDLVDDFDMKDVKEKAQLGIIDGAILTKLQRMQDEADKLGTEDLKNLINEVSDAYSKHNLNLALEKLQEIQELLGDSRIALEKIGIQGETDQQFFLQKFINTENFEKLHGEMFSHQGLDISKFTEIYEKFIHDSEHRIASALIGLSFDHQLDAATLSEAVDRLETLPELSGSQVMIGKMAKKECLRLLKEEIKTNPSIIQDFKEVIKSAQELSLMASKLKKPTQFQIEMQNLLSHELMKIQTSIHKREIVKDLPAIKASLGNLKKAIQISEKFDLTPLATTDLKFLNPVFKWLEKPEAEFEDSVKLLELYQKPEITNQADYEFFLEKFINHDDFDAIEDSLRLTQSLDVSEIKAIYAQPTIDNNSKLIEAFLSESRDVFSQKSITIAQIANDWMRDLHIFSLAGNAGSIGTQQDTNLEKYIKLKDAIRLIAKQCGELNEFDAVLRKQNALVLNSNDLDKEQSLTSLVAILTKLDLKKKDCKTIKILRAMTQANHMDILAPKTFVESLGYTPPPSGYISVPRELSFSGDIITISAKADYKLESTQDKSQFVAVKAKLEHVYDKEMTVCQETQLTTDMVDVSQIPSAMQATIKNMLNVNIRV